MARSRPVSPGAPNIERYWHLDHQTPSLGCSDCPDFTVCGGLKIRRGLYNCLDFCCGNGECSGPCPKNARAYVDHLREIGGSFDISNVPRSAPVPAPFLDDVIPVLFHEGSIPEVKQLSWVCLSLHHLYSRRDGAMRFSSAEELRGAFGIAATTNIMVTGLDQDEAVEAWWGLGRDARREAIRALKTLGIQFATTPNLSLALNEPRHKGMHAISRNCLMHHEFLSEGMPAALHLGAVTDRDYDRIAEFVTARPEVTHLGVDFVTGPARTGRKQWHVDRIKALASNAGRPLHLIVRGRVDVLAPFAEVFDQITYLDTDAFMRTIKRRYLSPHGNLKLRARSVRTEAGASLIDIWENNWTRRKAYVRAVRASL